MSSQDLPEPMLTAIQSNNLPLVQALYTSSTPRIPLSSIATSSAHHARPSILSWCFESGFQAPCTTTTNHPLYTAAVYSASIPIFRVLLTHGWDLNAHESEMCGDTLASAVVSSNYSLAKWLLENGHRPTPHDFMHGPSTIAAAVSQDRGSIDMVKLLLAHGTDLAETGAAIAAVEEGNVEALRLLLEYGVDVEDREMWWYPFDEERDEPEESQGTALYRACRQGRVECVELLLERGADTKAKDDGGTSCLAIAKKRGHQEVVKLLEKLGAKE